MNYFLNNKTINYFYFNYYILKYALVKLYFNELF